jgi:AraC-like DNA-binding protein
MPAACAAWSPAGIRHSIEPLKPSRVRTLYISHLRAQQTRKTGAVLRVSGLLRAVIDHIGRLEALRDANAAEKRLAAVLIDQIVDQRELPLFVPTLRSPLTRRVGAALQSDPADTPRIRELAAEVGVSDRTLERQFVADAGMTIGEWRQRSRVSRAIELLAAGGDVKDVALEVGYATSSAFVSAFKKTAGVTPGKVR